MRQTCVKAIDVSAFLAHTVSMPTITIPRHVRATDELVAIPRREYEEFLRIRKYGSRSIGVKHSIKVPKNQEKFYDQLDRELTESLHDIETGRTHGPFGTAEEAIRFLHRKR